MFPYSCYNGDLFNFASYVGTSSVFLNVRKGAFTSVFVVLNIRTNLQDSLKPKFPNINREQLVKTSHRVSPRVEERFEGSLSMFTGRNHNRSTPRAHLSQYRAARRPASTYYDCKAKLVTIKKKNGFVY